MIRSSVNGPLLFLKYFRIDYGDKRVFSTAIIICLFPSVRGSTLDVRTSKDGPRTEMVNVNVIRADH